MIDKMNCEKLELDTAVYYDDVLSPAERSVVDRHLPHCPMCRQKLSEFQNIQRHFRMTTQPVLTHEALSSLRGRISNELEENVADRGFSAGFAAWRRAFLIPTLAGTAASLVFGSLIFWSLMTANTGASDEYAIYEKTEQSSTLLASSSPVSSGNYDMDPLTFANERLSVSSVSPSVNPRGALIALTKSFVRGEMKDDEVVVVADVFGNGLARIAEVVEPSSDRRAVRELEKALRSNPDFAPPFMPANMDNRSDSVRVILKFQTVTVDIQE